MQKRICILHIVILGIVLGQTGCMTTDLEYISRWAQFWFDRKDAQVGVSSFRQIEKSSGLASPSSLVQPKGKIEDEIPDGIEVVYLDTDTSGWPITQRLGIRHDIKGNKIHYYSADASKAQKIGQGWKEVSGSIGNFWVGIPGEYIGRDTNKIYASTWEWLTKDRNPRTRNHLGGGITKKPHVIPTKWMPQPSNVLYHQGSGLARGFRSDGTHERTQWLEDKPWE